MLMFNQKISFRIFTLLAFLSCAGFIFTPVSVEAAKKSKKSAKKKKTINKPKDIDVMSLAGKSFNRDELADRKRDEAIASMKGLIKQIPPGIQRAELLFRLAELYWEKSKSAYFKEMQEYEKKYAKYMEAQQKGKRSREPKVNNRKSNKIRGQALKIYKNLTKKYRKFPRMDEVYFNLGYNLYEMGKKNEGVRQYWNLIKRYPKSSYVPDAYLAIGEYFFNSNKLAKAVTAYKKARSFKGSKVYIFALYKLAWCDYNMGEYENAIQKFKDVISYSNELKAKGAKVDQNRIRLSREAIRDVVLAYSQTDIGEAAREYFDEIVGVEEGRKLFSRLGSLYLEQGKNELSIQVSMALIDEKPNHPDAPRFQKRIADAYDKMNDKKRAAKAINDLIDIYGAGSPWQIANANNKRALDRAKRLSQTSLRDLVTQYHNEAQKTKSDKTYSVAQNMYKKYLDTFPKSDDSYNMRFYYAEILYLRQEWKDAAVAYENVVNQNEKGQYTKNAAYNAILAWENVVNKVKKVKRKKLNEKARKGKVKKVVKKLQRLSKGKDYTKKPIPQDEVKMAAACDNYFRLYPKDKDLPQLKFKAAFVYHKYYHFEDSAKRFFDIIDKYPRKEFSRKSMDLILNSFEVKDDWANLNKWSRKFYGDKRLMNPSIKGVKSFKKQLYKVMQGSQYKIVMGLEKKDKAKAAAGYVAFVDEFPESEFADKALYNAVNFYSDLKLLDKAIVSAERLNKEFPKSTLTEENIYFLAKLYEQVADFKTATKYNLSLLKKFPKTKKYCDVLFNTFAFQQGFEDYKNAIKNMNLFMKKCKKTNEKDFPKITYLTAQLKEKMGKDRDAIKIYERYIKKFSSKVEGHKPVEALMTILKIHEKRPKRNKAKIKSMLNRIRLVVNKINDQAVLDRLVVKNAKARAEFFFTEKEFNAYLKLKFSGRSKKDAKVLKAFMADYDKLKKRYTEIINIGDAEYAIASLGRLGQINLHFASSLLDAPVPSDLDMDQADLYMSMLSEKAAPVEERAIQAFETAMEKAFEFEVYGKWTDLAQGKLFDIKGEGLDRVRSLPLSYRTSYELAAPYRSEK